MARQEHLRILERGAEVWNQWRRQHPRIKPRLKRARLIATNLAQANLSNAELWGATIVNTDLRGANLRGANLSKASFWMSRLDEADLTGAAMNHTKVLQSTFVSANLGGTKFRDANLEYVSLNNADLTGVDLQNADIRAVDFTDANLSNATIGSTVFISCSFKSARGLDSVNHQKASTVSIDTVYNSKESLTYNFLQGSGVPRDFIDYLRAQNKSAEQFHSCFISYASQDQEFAQRLYTDLKFHYGVDCWFAAADLKIGDNFPESIEKAIRGKEKLVVVLSKNSVNSHWVETEVRAALERGRQRHRQVLLPIMIDGAVRSTRKAWAAQIRREWNIGEFLEWNSAEAYAAGMKQLVDALRYAKRRSANKSSVSRDQGF